MKKMYLGFIAILMIAAVAVWNVELANANDQTTSLPGSSFTTVNNVDGLKVVDKLKDWWNKKVYRCVPTKCIYKLTVTLNSATGSANINYETEGTVLNCEEGSDVAHCWECRSCNASL